jgi:site-specific DNA-methyltransferase (adenine-specific)
MAMFPPSVPHHFIDRYSNEGDIILDPFSGRGTTVLEASFMNRTGIGNDKNPLAYLLTKAKSNVPQKGRIISKINQLEREFDPLIINIEEENRNIKMIYSKSTLKQLVFLKNRLNWERSNVDAFITGMILGILHGNSETYLSVGMPNTFSMSPSYVRKYIKEHKLKKPNKNVFEILRKKLDRCYQRPDKKGIAYNHDVRNMFRIRDSSVHLIITSPPYTRVIRYGEFNWIRLWFLGKIGKEVDTKLFFSQSTDKYSVFITDALKEMKRVLKPRGKAVLVIGDVKDRESKKVYNLAEIVWERCAKPLGFKLAKPIIADVVSDDTKVSKIWGEKKGNATKIDRILILQKQPGY